MTVLPRSSIGLVLAAALAASPAATAQEAQVTTVDPVMLRDGSAKGMVVRLSFPSRGRDLPVVILSHGNRLSREDYRPLVAALARAGYLVVQPDHADASIGGFAPPGPQPDDVWRTRIEQVRWIAAHPDVPVRGVAALRGRVDTSRIAIIGHSFGGHTAALAMGATIEEPDGGRLARHDAPSIRAAVLLAPPGDAAGLTEEWKRRAPYLKLDWTTMRGPVLTINGGADMTPLTDRGPGWHDDPYKLGPVGRDMCLMVVAGAGHYLGGIDSPLRPPAGDATPERRARVIGATIGFLNAKLGHGADAAAAWSGIRAGLDCK
ncbi:alpha/beta hydrolase family protein [Sphingopyxis panaciterrulae]|uniref:Putative dienelactone hydrolase n=1 Tax=Sphingopyxis panaciterrulae TaxID=462372 RepID=A0A7W9B9G4_9SPHN|nr:chlorophyllase [Sphingopyxis panaciterrulae]MBB5708650.1 putative dienelactone hydrolase [Sphingopyxis panaciterrulae]